MWNVKLLPGFFRGHSGCDLIDTLWNVKLIIITQRVETVDLIDTLWNVKHIVRLDVFGNDKI